MNNNSVRKNKLEQYLTILETENKLLDKGDKRTFSDGLNIREYSLNNRERIYNIISLDDELLEKYPKACKLIKDEYTRFKLKKEKKKYQEFFEIIEKEKEIPKASRDYEFKDGTKIKGFWTNYREKIVEQISLEENKKKYPTAYKTIMYAYNVFLMLKEYNYGKYFKYVEDEGRIIQETDTKYDEVTRKLWDNNKEKIYQSICQDNFKNSYKKAYKIIREEYKKYLKDYIIEFLSKIEELKYLPRYNETIQLINNTKLGEFWDKYKKEIYEFITNNDLSEEYPVAIELILKHFSKKTRIVGKRNQSKIVMICLKNKININKCMYVIEHINYEEFVAKCSYLESTNQKINVSGKLHEIFTMSSLNMKEKYGYTTEEMINEFYKEKKRKK